ncbi:MAG: tetratricopeptide repeat protein, partial [Flavobacteriales bacterium]|nr:tetratricopeptide repeat protein [Flavobacteriales bacterium]
MRHAFLTSALLVLCLPMRAQTIAPAWADSVTEQLAGSPIEDHEATLPLVRRLLAHYDQRRDTCGMAQSAVAMGSCYDHLGKLDSSLYVLLLANDWKDHDCDPELPFRVALNLSSVYLSLEEFERADSICGLALEQRIDGGYSKHHSDLLFNRAVAKANQGDLDGADAQFKALEEQARAKGDAISEIDALLNRGALRGMQKDLPGAQRHLEAALARCKEVDCPIRATILKNLSSVAGNRGDYALAMALGDSALVYAKASGDL